MTTLRLRTLSVFINRVHQKAAQHLLSIRYYRFTGFTLWVHLRFS